MSMKIQHKALNAIAGFVLAEIPNRNLVHSHHCQRGMEMSEEIICGDILPWKQTHVHGSTSKHIVCMINQFKAIKQSPSSETQ